MLISIMQPTWLSWIGYFDLIDQSDLFVLLDDAQFSKHTWQQRNRIKINDSLAWLTVPVYTKGRLGQKINEVEIDRRRFPEKLLFQIKQHYVKSLFFSDYFSEFEDLLLNHQSDLLCDLNLLVLSWFLDKLNIDTEIVIASTLNAKGIRGSRTVKILKELGAFKYLSPIGSYEYLNEDIGFFKKNNIDIVFQNYKHPEYRQVYPPFLNGASVLDLLFNEGENSLNIIRSGRLNNIPYDRILK